MMSDIALSLPRKQGQIYHMLEAGEDVHVLNLYQRVIGKETNDQRFAQQVLGPYFTRLNRRLREKKLHVAPGSLKGTYRLSPLS